MTEQITFEQALKFVSFKIDERGLWVIDNIHGCVSGNVYGDIDGDVFGSIRGNVDCHVYGDIRGSVLGDVKGEVVGNIGDTAPTAEIINHPLTNEECKKLQLHVYCQTNRLRHVDCMRAAYDFAIQQITNS